MAFDPARLPEMIAEGLRDLGDDLVTERALSLAVTPRLEMRAWDYGAPDTAYPCWIVIEHADSATGIAYCEQGFGPRCPWGLLHLDPADSMGADCSWYPSLGEALLDSWLVSDLLRERPRTTPPGS